jgi:hypothetical protein
MDVNCCLRRRLSQRGFPPLTSRSTAAIIGFLYVYDLPLRLASTTCLYGLPLRPASTACLYSLPLRPASTVCLHHVIAIIIIIIVHLLFKRNIYLSLYM